MPQSFRKSRRIVVATRKRKTRSAERRFPIYDLQIRYGGKISVGRHNRTIAKSQRDRAIHHVNNLHLPSAASKIGRYPKIAPEQRKPKSSQADRLPTPDRQATTIR